MEGAPVRVGAKPLLVYHMDAGGATIQVSSVLAYVYSSALTAVVNGVAGQASTLSPASEVDLFYLWDTTGQAADDLTWFLRITLADGRVVDRPETPGDLTLISPASKYDRWVKRARDWMGSAQVGEATEFLTWRQVRDAVLAAIEEYSRVHGRLVQATQALTASVWEYTLPADFVEGVSYFELGGVEYPVDAAIQSYPMLEYPRDFTYDLARGKLIFQPGYLPSAGQSVRYAYRARHTLSDTTDTLPARAFHAIAQYGAGLALEVAAAKAASLGDASVGAAAVDYKSKQEQFSSVARVFKEAGRKAWGGAGAICGVRRQDG